MLAIAYTAEDVFGVFGTVGETHTMWLIPSSTDVMRAMWYASQGVPQFDGYEQTLFDLLMAGF